MILIVAHQQNFALTIRIPFVQMCLFAVRIHVGIRRKRSWTIGTGVQMDASVGGHVFPQCYGRFK